MPGDVVLPWGPCIETNKLPSQVNIPDGNRFADSSLLLPFLAAPFMAYNIIPWLDTRLQSPMSWGPTSCRTWPIHILLLSSTPDDYLRALYGAYNLASLTRLSGCTQSRHLINQLGTAFPLAKLLCIPSFPLGSNSQLEVTLPLCKYTLLLYQSSIAYTFHSVYGL